MAETSALEAGGIAWSKDLLPLVEWFSGYAGPPLPAGARLAPYLEVADGSVFIQALRADVAAGPVAPRSRQGGLEQDLRLLKQYLGL